MFKLLTESEKMLKKRKKHLRNLFKKWVYCCDPKEDFLNKKAQFVNSYNKLKNEKNQIKIYVKNSIGIWIECESANYYSIKQYLNYVFGSVNLEPYQFYYHGLKLKTP